MKIPVWLATLLGTAILAGQAWILSEIVNLKTEMSAVKAKLEYLQQPGPNNQPDPVTVARVINLLNEKAAERQMRNTQTGP